MTIIANKYKLLEKIGSGSFGEIYKGENIRTKELVAIKIECIKNGTSLLKNESIKYNYLSKIKGIPNIKWFGKDNCYYFMVINLLGKSLKQFFLETKTQYASFSPNYIIDIGIKMINLVMNIHEKGLIHRDIKPDNFLFGLNDSDQLYLIDFGFCKCYLNNFQHIPFKNTNKLIGSPNYASINAHKCFELSRRDDLESIGYILLYLYNGKLEWEEIDFLEKNDKILLLKENIISSSIPDFLREYFHRIRNINFEETPNYKILLNILSGERV
jgi:serine/threonine protein kinase